MSFQVAQDERAPAPSGAAAGDPARSVWAFVAAAVAVPLLFFALIGWRAYDAALADLERRADATATLLHQHATRQFKSYAFTASLVEDRAFALGWPDPAGTQALLQFARHLVANADQVAAIRLIDAAGHVATTGEVTPTPDPTGAEREIVDALAAGAPATVGSAYRMPVSGREVFDVARRHATPDGRFNGVVLLSAPVSALGDFYNSVSPRPGDALALIRADGQMVLRHPRVDAPLPRLEHGLPDAIRTAPDQGRYRYAGIADGVERVYAYRRLADFPVYVAYGADVAQVWAAWWNEMMVPTAVTAAAMLLLLSVAHLERRRALAERRMLARLHDEMGRRAKAEATLRHTQRLEMLGQIVGGIAHDFNNLLTVVTTNLYLAGTRTEDNAWQPFVTVASEAAFRGGQLTRQLLSFARQQQLDPEVFDLNDCLDRLATGMLRQSLRGDIRIERDGEPGLWPIEADRGQLELAVLNLAINARDAMPKGGVLRLVTRNLHCADPFTSPTGQAGDFVALRVEDTGAGIPPEVIERVFEPFFTTKEVGKGTGLGLSMVYGFAQQSGGTARIDSRPGAGTTVTLLLPRALPHALADAPAGTAPDGAVARPAGRGRVLMVEDSPEIAATVAMLLDEMGFSVLHVASAADALDTLAQHRRGFDCVFTDIVMPGGMNGVELAREIRRRYPDMPVLLATGYSDAANAATEEGFRVLRKPYDPKTLAEALNALQVARPVTV
ncbi:ATP-binding protein [Azospirillum sp.]|uniref:ATP-binding protein n=1 Tax=Azospirillum sp. TaxID=34012 RepID=UPI002D36AB72|nr:ATP-binding protein [Azospirillum sp.]HYD64202.1 ATP-binding protein [Azospirillum sp.]